MRQINKRKTNLVQYVQKSHIQTGEVQKQKLQMKYTCHVEPKNGIGTWGCRGEKGNSQDDKNSKSSDRP